MQNKKIQIPQQHQNVVHKIDQILRQKQSNIQAHEQFVITSNDSYQDTINNSSTGIKGFDEVLNGGFPKGSIVLLAGSSGSGKTIFSSQWLFEGVKNNEKGIYITLTEPLFKILENLEKLSYYNKEAIEQEKLTIIDLREKSTEKGFDQKKILEFIEAELKRTNAKRLCIDSITVIAYQIDDKAQIRAFIFALGTILATLGCTTILTSETVEMNKYSVYGVEEFISDAIIRLDQIKINDELQRKLQIVKVRGKNYRTEDMYFKITKNGISVFPKLKIPLEHFSSTERISTGITTLDEMLDGGIFSGSSTLIAGPAGTGKSMFGLSFLAEGLKKGESCLYAGFEESKEQVIRNAGNFGWDFEKYEREGTLVLRCIYPSEKQIEEHLADIKHIVEEKRIKRCVIDSLSAISGSCSLDAFISFSKRLNGYLKTKKVTPILTSATTSLIGMSKFIETHLSAITDNIILLRYVEMRGKVQCVINVIKMRGSKHSSSLRIFDITDKGITIGKSLEDYEGVTTGVSKKIAELEKESANLKKIIKEKEKAEKALLESEEKYRDLFENANDIIQAVNPDGTFLYVNQAWKKTLGYSEKEISNLKVFDIVHKDCKKHCMDIFKQVISGKNVGNVEVSFVTKDGSIINVEGSINCRIKKGKPVSTRAIFRDITYRKQAEEKIKQQNTRLKQLNRLKSEFFDVTSREIRQPVAILKGYIQMLLNHSFGVITETQRKPLEIIVGNVNRLDSLSSNLLDISRLEVGDMKFIPKKTNIGQMIKKTVETMQSSADSKDIKINLEYGDKVPDLIIDQYRIKQVIMNLLDNAIKFSPEGSVINLRAKKQENNFLFEIQDFGQGIPKDKQERVFETFYRVNEGINEKFKGGGIGLAISQGIIIVHGGKIWCESKEDAGSTFRFTLPIKNVEDMKTSYKGFNPFGSVHEIKDAENNKKNKS